MLIPSFDELRGSPGRPRVHPNGFIQLDLSERRRLHVWPDTPLPIRIPQVTIHDHVYPYSSTVVLGSLRHIVYQVEEDRDGDHVVLLARRFQDGRRSSQLEPTLGPILDRTRYSIRSCHEHIIRVGETYAFPAFEFHETRWDGLAATMLEVGEYNPADRPRVLCPIGHEVYELFDRFCVDQEVLWGVIRRVYQHL